jgi:hypothetical protein
MAKCYIGIDNGVSGTIAILNADGAKFEPTPVNEVFDYASSKGNKIHRVDHQKLYELLDSCETTKTDCKVFMERPLKNPKLFMASISAVRAFEITLLCVQQLGFAFEVIDSRKWQKYFFPAVSGKDNLKKASMQKGIELFPSLKKFVMQHKDADGLLIAEWARRNNL